MDLDKITTENFNKYALKLFRHQAKNNSIYAEFLHHLKIKPHKIQSILEIPFLPISFFKSHEIKTNDFDSEIIFTSSGTTGQKTSKHFVKNLNLYRKSFLKGFEYFYGNVEEYCILALLPSYLERTGSSLVFMADELIKKSNHPESNFYLDEEKKLLKTLKNLIQKKQKTLLIGVSFALLDLAEKHDLKFSNEIIVLETGGMKGRRKEIIRKELHEILTKSFGIEKIHSEYGMTELLSQAYSKGNGIFETPPWMKILVRNTSDPFQIAEKNASGGINIIDLANQDSCAFIATEDLGKIHSNKTFEVLGRFDNSDVRGCNLLVF